MKSERIPMRRALAVTVMVLTALEAATVVVSWLVPAIYPYSHVRPLLSPEGARFLVGSLVSAMSVPPLLWLVMCAMSWGVLSESGLLQAIVLFARRPHGHPFIIRLSLYAAAAVFLIFVAIVSLLTFAPGAILLSATGEIRGSSFLMGLIPLLALAVGFSAAAYGFFSSRFSSSSSLFGAMCHGLCSASPLIVLYVFVMQLLLSLLYAFGYSGMMTAAG